MTEYDKPKLAQNTFLNRLHLSDWIYFAYLAVITGILLVFNGRVAFWWLYVPAHFAGAFLFISIIKKYTQTPTRFWNFLRHWYPLLNIPVLFGELGHLVHKVHPYDFDQELMEIDRVIFGGNPTVMLEVLNTPIFTEYMYLTYFSYFFFPPVLCGILYHHGKLREFRISLAAVMAGYATSYLGYFLVPARCPRFHLEELGHTPQVVLDGYVIAPFVDWFVHTFEPIHRDCFPSGHAELALICTILAFWYTRRSFYVMAPVAMSLVLSTVYLRYHYAIDVIAGAVLAILIAALIPPICRVMEKEKRIRN